VAGAADSAAWTAHLPPGVAPEDVDLLADRSLPGRWIRRWRERPEWPQLRDLDGTWIGSDELEERSRGAALGLLGQGLERGERFVVCAPTSAALVIAVLAALRAGLVVVPINESYTETEVRRIVGDARPAGAAVHDPERGRWIGSAAPGPVEVMPIAQLPTRSAAASGVDGVGGDDPALLIYTSGTTGKPKGVPLTHANLLSSASALKLAWRWEPDDRLLLTLPLFHVHGLGAGLFGSLCAGASVVLRPGFDADDVVASSGDSGVTLFFGVPAMYQRLAAAGGAAALGGLRLLVSGSAPLPAKLSDEIARQAGQVPLERYGMTETVMLTSNPYDGARKPGTVGFPLPGVSVRLAGDGEVQVRGPNVIDLYYERPDADADAFTGDRWFRTGDLGELDDDGYLRLVGRSKELIISGGFNVYPREVEEAIATHPDVREVAVIGRPSDRWGEEVTAVVVAERPVEEEQLRVHAAGRLAPYKVPKRIEFVSELPRNALGKVVRGDL
jgi:malonyl-CoA/methylmalonyl-CoA synthetase